MFDNMRNLIAEKRSGESFNLKNIPAHLQNVFGMAPTASGVSVSEEKSLSLTAVWSCISIISRTMATMPLPVFNRTDRKNKEIAYENPLYELLHNNPNPEQTAFQWRSLMAVHQLLWGAGISWIEFDNRGQPIALWPIAPWRASPERTKSGDLVYKVTMLDGKQNVYQASEVVVFESMSTTRDRWMSPIQVHRETLGAAMGVKEFGARTFGQGVNPAGILSGVKFGKEDSQESFRKKFGGYEGLGNAHKLMFIEDGTTFEKVGLPPQDAQYLETRAYNVTEIARMYNVPNFMLNLSDGSSNWGTGLEEQELNKKLIFSRFYFTEFNMDGLQRANLKARTESYWKRWQMGSMSPDEIRAKENENPIPNELGAHYYLPLNMGTTENVIAGNTGKGDSSTEIDPKNSEEDETDE
ncbi:MAG: phage portal protein [Candidatus Hodarchaeales archaeon]